MILSIGENPKISSNNGLNNWDHFLMRLREDFETSQKLPCSIDRTHLTRIPKLIARTETQELETDCPEENVGMQKICLPRLSEGQDVQPCMSEPEAHQPLAENSATQLWSPGLGFTFLEILIVTTIIAVIAAITIPRFRTTYENFRIHSLADHLTYLTQAAHELSIIEGRLYKIIIRKDSDISMLKETSNHQGFESLSGGIGKSKSIPLGYKVKCDENEILFYPNGESTQTVIVIENDLGAKMKLNVTETGASSQQW